VFKTMFSTNMKEKESGVVKIAISKETAEALLEYIYCGTCTNLIAVAESLLGAADTFMLDEFKAQIGQALCKTITLENVIDRLILAELHTELKLKYDCVDFIGKNFKDIAVDDKFKKMSLSHEILFHEVVYEVSRKIPK